MLTVLTDHDEGPKDGSGGERLAGHYGLDVVQASVLAAQQRSSQAGAPGLRRG